MNKILLFLLVFWLFTLFQGNSQTLLPPLEEMPLSKKAFVLLKDGSQINGELLNTTSGRGINKVVIRDDSGQRHELKADKIFEFGIFSNDLVKAQYLNESSASIKALFKTDRSAVKLNDYVVFRNAQLKGGKELLLQLLNPHFDDKIQVYHSVNSRKSTALRKGTITVTGEMQRAYLVSKYGAQISKVKKENYKKAFENLFEDCPNLIEIRKPKFQDLGKHIFYYTNDCKTIADKYFLEE
ncbi:hypothetical protein [Cecembia rubra]|uniref:Uncharacterized protein n=1 Tax=Cecembia rubra TaxID=1485585 RepID=A0A2P8EE13_9BACT|nr:hypothetical protein [Cecembia rubra]PSL07719.1 hypothetical protein CLV48_101657 [Cecembia rubra]